MHGIDQSWCKELGALMAAVAKAWPETGRVPDCDGTGEGGFPFRSIGWIYSFDDRRTLWQVDGHGTALFRIR